MTDLVTHPLPPIYSENSRILILGTMPSPASRKNGFYYSHPQNRFWRVMSAVLDESLPVNNEERTCLLLRHRIALWDVLASCMIKGAEDSSIKEPKPNDIPSLLTKAPIQAVFTTGKTAFKLYEKLCLPDTGIIATALPSTSPANQRYSLDALIREYRAILDHL